MLSPVPPQDPLRREYPPVPAKPPPFDLDALQRISKPEPRRLRWRRNRGRGNATELVDAAPKVTTSRASVVMLAIQPPEEQRAMLRAALAAGGAEYSLPPRLTLRNGLSMQDQAAWGDCIQAVTRAWKPFTVRLQPPEVVDSRMLCLAPVGDRVADLQQALGHSLFAAGFVARVGDVSTPTMLLASTFTGATHAELHDLGSVMRDLVPFPIDFRVGELYALSEARGEDQPPIAVYPFGG
jgi:hypothetical protein